MRGTVALYAGHPAVALADLAAEVATEVRLLRAVQAEHGRAGCDEHRDYPESSDGEGAPADAYACRPGQRPTQSKVARLAQGLISGPVVTPMRGPQAGCRVAR